MDMDWDLFPDPTMSEGPESYAFSVGGRLSCPTLDSYRSFHRSSPLRGLRFPINALELFPEAYNAWDNGGEASYAFPGNHVTCGEFKQSLKFFRVFWYARALGWDRPGVLFRPSKHGEYVDPAICRTRLTTGHGQTTHLCKGRSSMHSFAFNAAV